MIESYGQHTTGPVVLQADIDMRAFLFSASLGTGLRPLTDETLMKMDLSYIDNWSLRLDFKILTPLQNVPFCPITASDTNFNPRNIQYIPVVEIFSFLVLEQN